MFRGTFEKPQKPKNLQKPFQPIFPLGEETGQRPGIQGTMDASGFALLMANLRTLSILRTLSNLSVGKHENGPLNPKP